MNTSFRLAGQTTVVEIEGEIDLGHSASLRRLLLDALQKANRLAISLNSVSYIDSSGIATLIEALKEAQRLRKDLVLFGLSQAAHDVFELTHVIRVFRVYETEQEALQP